MRLLKFIPGLLFLRWLPFGFTVRWLIRLGFWSSLGYAAYRVLKPPVPATKSPSMSYSASGWAPPASPPADSRFASGISPDAELSAVEGLVDEIIAEADALAEAEAIAAEVFAAVREPGEEIVAETITIDDTGMATIELETETFAVPNWIRGDGTENCPAGYPIKAKASSLIYHTHDSRNYDVTIPDVCFASVEDAQAAGYRAPFR
jgi:hypothetical protein